MISLLAVIRAVSLCTRKLGLNAFLFLRSWNRFDVTADSRSLGFLLGRLTETKHKPCTKAKQITPGCLDVMQAAFPKFVCVCQTGSADVASSQSESMATSGLNIK